MRIFDWPGRVSGARLILIGIANALDLTERLLPRLVASHHRPFHISFQPYSREQIIDIISARLRASNDIAEKTIKTCGLPSAVKFDPLAIRLCASKVAASSGDVRKALELCVRASELAKSEASSLDTIVSLKENIPNPNSDLPPKHIITTLRHISQAIRESQVSFDGSLSFNTYCCLVIWHNYY
ncbi:unnamed protein product [Protopolystoma xenopodis]|uniref:Uncharacterized protein n=1 Tax=Protopolystoma xenopodis TaxID=117903 RepID=A0A448X9E1_9PLAT|nr:unnamed protein product [Protopolystoma xenopodis]